MARTKARETYGNGSITQETRNGKPLKDTWRVCISLGKDETGKRRKTQRIVHGSLADARKACKQLLAQYEHIDPSSVQMTFQDALSAWSTSMRNSSTCAASKLRDYETRLAYMAEALGRKPLTSIKQADIEGALSDIKERRGLSQRTLKDIVTLTRRVFEYALTNDWLVKNPCRGVANPKPDSTPNRRSLSPEEVAKLHAALDRSEASAYGKLTEKESRQFENGNRCGPSQLQGLAHLSGLMAVRIMLATGVRRGECLGLAWKAVDFASSSLLIGCSYNSDGILKSPKTNAGMRCLSIDADTLSHLETWKAFQTHALHLISQQGVATPQPEDRPVCCNCLGVFYDPHNLSRWWQAYRKQIGFDGLKLHELRHTQASMLLGAGVDLKTLQHRLGHADASLTLNTYSHLIPANDHAAANLMGSLMLQSEESAQIVYLDRRTA